MEYAGINTHTSTVIGGWDTVMDTAATAGSSQENEPLSIDDNAEEYDKEPQRNPWESLQMGDRVMHKSWGEGQIMSLDDKYIFVKFADRESKFLFPSAFEAGYLGVC